jgi:hypothetical protein
MEIAHTQKPFTIIFLAISKASWREGVLIFLFPRGGILGGKSKAWASLLLLIIRV